MSDIAAVLELIIEPRNDEYHLDDDRWRAQVDSLRRELHDRVDTTDRARPMPGTKGAVDELIVALGSAGAFTAMLECFRAWLGRDKARTIEVRWTVDGTEQHVTLHGDGVDAETMREVARAAAARVGGSGWPADTGRS